MAKAREKRLKLGLLNARSLNTGQDEFTAMILKYKLDILAINESWIRDGEEALAPVIPNYRFVHKARKGKRGGGVGFYIRNGITTRVRHHPQAALEQLWIEVRLPGGSLALGTAYRPESVSIDDALDSLSESVNVMARCDYTCILGDLNINLRLDDSKQAKQLMSFCNQHSLDQLVQEPTRITDNTETILDLILTDSPARCKNIKIVHNYCLSDHATVMLDFDLKRPKCVKQVKYQRALHEIISDLFEKDLESIPWNSIDQADNVDEMVTTFNNYILTLFDLHAPVKKYIIKDKSKPWITDTIKFIMSLRDDALTKFHKNKTDSAKEYYCSLKNYVTTAIKHEKKAYFNSFINNNLKKPSILWKNLKNTATLTERHLDCIPDHINDPNQISDHFLKLPPAKNIDLKLVIDNMTDNNHDTSTTFDLKPTTETEVLKVINNISTKSLGYDGLSIEMIKMTLPTTLPIITKIINKSFETHTFPGLWKKALVRPIPKKDKVEDLKDLRPVSILPVLSKVLERVVMKQILEYLDSCNIIPKFQSGFRRGHGTETALLNVTDDISEASDMGLSSILVLLDYTRAFDCLHPQLLLAKLKHYGFSNNTCNWFETYLTNREQTVVTYAADGTKMSSPSKTVDRGVPQGSILSPILFTIFTADLPNCIKTCKYHLYADDTQLYYSFDPRDTQEAIKNINADLQRIYNWSENNSLCLNPAKSQVLILGTKHQIKRVFDSDEDILINNVALEKVKSARNLGLILDGEQKYESHVNGKVRNAFFKLKTLYKNRPNLKEELRLLLADLLVLSPFNYCGTIISPNLKAQSEKAIQRVQNACIRFCYNVPRREYITPYLNKKGILNMKARSELQYACTVQRVIWNKKPEYLFEKLTWNKNISQRSLRPAVYNMLKIPKHKSTRFRGSFKFHAASIWNVLPPPMRTKMSTECFKAKYKTALLKKQLAAENLRRGYWKSLPLKNYF